MKIKVTKLDIKLINNIEIPFCEEPNDKAVPCKACDCVDGILCWTFGGAGPFCAGCFESLCDPDQALLLKERLAERLEERIINHESSKHQ